MIPRIVHDAAHAPNFGHSLVRIFQLFKLRHEHFIILDHLRDLLRGILHGCSDVRPIYHQNPTGTSNCREYR